MLVVKLEVHPGGDSSRPESIGELRIGNVSNLAEVSDYMASVLDGKGRCTGMLHVKGHHRSDGAWALVRQVIEQMDASPRPERAPDTL